MGYKLKSAIKLLVAIAIILCTQPSRGFSQSESEVDSLYSYYYDYILENQIGRDTTLFTDSEFVKKYVYWVLTEILGEKTTALYTKQLFFDKGDNWFLVFSKPLPKDDEAIDGIIRYKVDAKNTIGIIVRKADGEIIALTYF